MGAQSYKNNSNSKDEDKDKNNSISLLAVLGQYLHRQEGLGQGHRRLSTGRETVSQSQSLAEQPGLLPADAEAFASLAWLLSPPHSYEIDDGM